jgi:hypothetical protein
MTDFRALCAELTDTLDYWLKNSNLTDSDARDLVQNARAALAQPEPAPTDEELIAPIMWMLDDCVYDNDKGEIAQSLRRLIARWGTPANTTSDHL